MVCWHAQNGVVQCTNVQIEKHLWYHYSWCRSRQNWWAQVDKAIDIDCYGVLACKEWCCTVLKVIVVPLQQYSSIVGPGKIGGHGLIKQKNLKLMVYLHAQNDVVQEVSIVVLVGKIGGHGLIKQEITRNGKAPPSKASSMTDLINLSPMQRDCTSKNSTSKKSGFLIPIEHLQIC